MLGFSRTEQRIVGSLPVAIFILALVIFVHNGVTDSRTSRLRCWTPQEFTQSWDDYTNHFCSISKEVRPQNVINGRSVPEVFAAVFSTPLFLVLVGLVLTIPIIVGQFLGSVLKLTHETKNGRACWMAVLFHLSTRLFCLICAGAALGMTVKFSEDNLDLVARKEATALLRGARKPKLLRFEIPSYDCTMRIRRFGTGGFATYTVNCAVAQRAPFLLAEVSILTTWVALVFYVAWACVACVIHALLVISPTVRKNVTLLGSVKRRENVSPSVMEQDGKDSAL